MKKNLQSKIKELAQQIGSVDGFFDTSKVKQKVSELLEQLTILEYLESQIVNSENLKQAVDSKSYREKNWFQDPKPVPPSNYSDVLAEPLIEKIKDIVAQMPNESNQVDELLKDILPKKEIKKNDLEDFAAQYQKMPVFERKEEVKTKPESTIHVKASKETETTLEKPKSINDIANQNNTIGLNDRLAFIKHLFDNSTQDYTRILSQINSMSNFEEIEAFINNTVKPDYNHWTGKEIYLERFLAILKRKFN